MRRNKVVPVNAVPGIVYDSGRTMARKAGTTARFQPWVGFRTEKGLYETLDKALGGVLGQGSLIEVKHQRQGGVEVKQHWFLGETLDFFPLTEGPVAPTITASLHPRSYQATLEAGLGMRWGDGERSKLAVRGYLALLGEAGVVAPVQLSVKSLMTDRLLLALIDHGRVCEAADALRPDGGAEQVGFCDLALPLGAAEAEEDFGRGESTPVLPLRSLHPAAVDAAYVAKRWRPELIAAAVERDWPEVRAWALGFAGGDEPPPAASRRPEPPRDDAAEAEMDSPQDEPPPAPAPAPTAGPPADAAEAEQRFFARYGDVIGGQTWQATQRYLGHLRAKPQSIEEWIAAAEDVRDRARQEATRAAAPPPAPEPAPTGSGNERADLTTAIRALLTAAQGAGVDIDPKSLPKGWERRPTADLRAAELNLRKLVAARVKALWKAEGMDRTPSAELTVDLEAAPARRLAEVLTAAAARAAEPQAA